MDTRRFRAGVLAAGALLSASCGGGGGGSSAATDTTAPTAVALPASDSAINGATSIVVTFSETINTNSLTVGGSLAGEAKAGVWSQTNNADDTLTIAPLAAWSSGQGKTFTINASDLVGNALAPITLTYSVDTTPPGAEVLPAGASTIATNDQIVVTFTESMQPATLVLGGTLAAESDGGVWSSAFVPNDRLTISPTAAWTGGSRALIVNATDLAGNALAALNLGYTVDASVATGVPTPANGGTLARDGSINVVFSKSMDPASLQLSGALTDEAGATAWSTTTVANDTVTIPPASQWTVGEARALTVNAQDTLGNAINPLTLTYDTGILFVSTAGDDGNAGSRSAPLKTIIAAVARTGYPEIRLQGGTYTGSVTVTAGVTLKGSYDTNWSLDLASSTIISGGAASGVLVIQDVAAPVNISNVRVSGANTFSPSASSYAVRVVNSSGPVKFESVIIAGGNGAAGANGMNGVGTPGAAAAGSVGQDAASYAVACDVTNRGNGGSGGGSDSRAGGRGGDGGTMDTACGFPGNDSATSGSQGSAATVYSALSYGDGGNGGAVCDGGVLGNNGRAGTNGVHGGGGSGGAFVEGAWVPAAGASGGLGTDGGGGGGGGGSGGCDTGTDSYGAGGGGGGAGGLRASAAGAGGGGGGASFALLSDTSTVEVRNSTITLGAGGRGGDGGAVGIGQLGGDGGFGGAGAGGSAGGGQGGDGGAGGNSGAGGGGAGGNVYGIYNLNSAMTITNVIYMGGTAGAGGAGGNGSNSGANGTVAQYH